MSDGREEREQTEREREQREREDRRDWVDRHLDDPWQPERGES